MTAMVPVPHSGPLGKITYARQLLEASRDLEEIKSIRDIALAAEEYARAQKLGAEAERYAAEIATRAERRIGQLLAETPPAPKGGDRRSEDFKGATPEPLKSPRQQVGKKLSARSQKLAQIPDAEFEKRMRDERAKVSAERLARIQRDRDAEQKRIAQARAQAAAQPEPIRAEIRHGDFRSVLADLRDVDAVITDPPYGREFLPLLADLAGWADKVLAADGVMAVLMGEAYLPEVYRLLDGGRPYRWTACYLTPGPGYVAHAARVQSGWKPLLVYGAGPRFADLIRAGNGAAAKSWHNWGQDYLAFATIVERLTAPGQTVADPFAGSGTTLLAARALGRHSVGADVDPAAVATARERLS